MSNFAPYSKMAKYYDAIYSQIFDYESEFKRVQSVIKKHFEGKAESVIDLACGTGNYTFLFAKSGYKATGIDISSKMISFAKGKASIQKNVGNPRFFRMDMTRRGNLPDKYDIACVLFGGFGYLLEDPKIKKFLDGVRDHLSQNGILICDFWQSSGVSPAAKTRAGWKSWEKVEADEKQIIRLNLSKYDSRRSVFKIIFDFYILDSRKENLLDAFSETHFLRTHTVRSMRKILKDSGFLPFGFYEADSRQSTTLKPQKASTFRVLVVAGAHMP